MEFVKSDRRHCMASMDAKCHLLRGVSTQVAAVDLVANTNITGCDVDTALANIAKYVLNTENLEVLCRGRGCDER
jgi:hypothetical protein